MDLKKEQIKNKRDTAHEDFLANRVMAVFTAAVLMLGGLTYLWNAYDVGTTFFAAMWINNILIWVSLAGVVAGAVWLAYDIKNGRLSKAAVLNGAMCLSLFLVLLFALLLIKYNYMIAKRVLYVFIPALAILHLVYCSYQREFFSICLTHTAICFATWVMARQEGRLAVAALVGSLAICLMAVAAFALCRKKDGVLTLGRLRIRLTDNKNISLGAVTAIYGLTALAVAAAFFLGIPYAYYILYGLAAFVLVEAVYFTVKLI